MATNDDEKYCRLMLMLVKGGTKLTKCYFEKRVQDLKPNSHNLNTPWTVDVFLLQNKELIFKSKKGREKETVYFPTDGDTTDLDNWDLSMFCFILPKVCDLTDSMLRDIDDLKEMRNFLSHLGSTALENSKYTTELRKFKVIATNICKEIDNDSFKQDIDKFIEEAEIGPLSISEMMRVMRTFYTSEQEIKATLSIHTKDHENILSEVQNNGRKLDNLTQILSGASIKLPGTDVEILVLNCNKEKETKMSKILVDMFDDEINNRTDLAELTNPTMIKLREAVKKTFEIFLTNGRTISSAENECVLLRLQCTSVSNLVKLFRDCINGELKNQLKTLETAVRGIRGFGQVELEAIIYEDEFWKVIRKTISAVDDFVRAAENNPRATVSIESAQGSQGTAIKLSIQYRSPRCHDALREAFKSGEVEEHVNTIQDAIATDYPNVSIKARLKAKSDMNPEEYYKTAEKPTKKMKNKKKVKEGTPKLITPLLPGSVLKQRLVECSELPVEEKDSGYGTSIHQTDSDSERRHKSTFADCQEPSEIESLNSSASECERNREVDVETDFDVNSNSFDDGTEKSLSKQEQIWVHELLKNGIKLNDSFLCELKANSKKHADFYEQLLDKNELYQRLDREPNKFVRGVIYHQGSHDAICKPTHSHHNFEVVISGRSKIGQAFNQDEVVVELLDNNQKKETRFGKVVGVLHREKNIKHPVFLCIPDDGETHIVRPMCNTVPKLHVIQDKLKESRKNPKARKNMIEIYKYYDYAEILSDSRIYPISPFEVESCVLLVALVSWELNEIYPRGAILKKFPRGDTLETGRAILSLRYRILPQNEDDETSSEWLKDCEEMKRNDKTHLVSFTIDKMQCKDLNYAFSVEKTENDYIVGVHVADVAAYITKGSPLDINAQMRSRTIFTDIARPIYMLPDEIAENLCSLKQGETRPTVSFFFFLNENGMTVQTEGDTFRIDRTFIKCEQNFSYSDAMTAIRSDSAISSDLRIIFKLMTGRRKSRLGASMFVLSEDEINKDEMDKDSIEAQCVVEELVVMVNECVAKMLYRNKISAPFFKESKPSVEQMDNFLRKYGDYLNVVVSLPNKIPGKQRCLEDAIINPDIEFFEAKDTWELMKCQAEKARSSLLDDSVHPLQCVIHQEWFAIKQNPCYINSKRAQDKENFSLGIEKYTHCALPSRRYTDLVVQRLVSAHIANKMCPYSEQEIDDICVQATSAFRKTSDYMRDIRSLTAAVAVKTHSNLINCFVKDISDKSVTVIDTSDYSSRKNELDVSFNLLDIGYIPSVFEDRNKWTRVRGTWRKRIYDMMKYVPVTEYDEPLPKNKTYFSGNQKADSKKPVILDHNRNVVFIKLHQFASLIKSASEGHLTDLKRKLKSVNAEVNYAGLEDVSTEITDNSVLMANTKFSHTFFCGQPVTLQLTSEPYQGVIRPKPMVFQITNTINMCVLHTEDPVLHLSHYETRSTQDKYMNVQQYSDTWLPIVLMEASLNAIGNDDCCNINNVSITCENNDIGSFQLPVDFCEARNIKFSGVASKIDFDEDDSKHAYDWLCIKCPLQEKQLDHCKAVDKSIWIGHARITEIIEIAGGTFSIKFKLHERSKKFPSEIIPNGNVSIEVLRKIEVDRRTESCLRRFRNLHDKKESLPVKIAIQRKCHKLDEGQRRIAELIERDLYFQVASDDPRRKPLPPNNQKQQEAIDTALQNRFTLIQGPPGTGKTYTGIKLIYLFNKINNFKSKEGNVRKQLLFCGPSNKSVDLVAKWMLHRLGNYCPDFVRVYGKATETLDFPIPGVAYSSRGSGVHRADKKLQNVTLHFLIRREGGKYAREINQMDEYFKSLTRKTTNDSMQNRTGAWKHKSLNETIKEYRLLVNKASKEELRKHHVILCTTGVIIDEAGMCPEPQCMVPLIVTKAEQVVLIGDHKQLRPIIKCKAAAELGLDKSLFERYATMKDSPASFIMLNEQYRMNPALCEFPSKQFYGGKLITMPGLWNKGTMEIWPTDITTEDPYPHVLIHIEGEELVLTVNTDDGNEQSRSNPREIEEVLKVYRYFLKEGVDQASINIISQYNAQCHAIRDKLDKERITNYNVNTVVSSQGGEWDYVIFSTVRSLPEYKIEVQSTLGWRKHNLGFITDKNQINVALTRARKGLIIIGNKNLLSCDPVWKKLVSHYEQRKCVKLPNEFPPTRRYRQQKHKDSRKHRQELFGQDNDDEQF